MQAMLSEGTRRARADHWAQLSDHVAWDMGTVRGQVGGGRAPQKRPKTLSTEGAPSAQDPRAIPKEGRGGPTRGGFLETLEPQSWEPPPSASPRAQPVSALWTAFQLDMVFSAIDSCVFTSL